MKELYVGRNAERKRRGPLRILTHLVKYVLVSVSRVAFAAHQSQ